MDTPGRHPEDATAEGLNEEDIDESFEQGDMDDAMSESDGEAGADNDSEPEEEGEDIAEDFQDDSVQGFFEHKDSIYCIAVSLTATDLCATGGGDEKAYVWSLSTSEQLATLDGHTDSVTSIEFSQNGSFLATAGMDGLIHVWTINAAERVTCTRATTLEAGSEVLWMHFHPTGQVLIAGTSDGTVWMWSIPKGAVLGVFAGHTASSTSGCWAPDGKSFSSVSEDGTIIQWDPKTISPKIRIETAQDERRSGGEQGWNVIALDPTGKICTVGSPEGKVKVINLANGALLASLDAQTDSIEAIVYAPSGKLLAIASIDGTIALYEVPSMKFRSTLKHDDAVVSLHFEPGTSDLFSCSVDKTVRKWDTRSSEQMRLWRGHTDAILCMAVQTGGKKVVTGGDDKVALVYDV